MGKYNRYPGEAKGIYMRVVDQFLAKSQYHPSWDKLLPRALATINPDYLEDLLTKDTWLPGIENALNAFNLPLDQVNYILVGESPYPRAQSANGYAFWDQAVTNLWSNTGLSKEVNRATSYRNIIKMLLVAEQRLPENATTQDDIAQLDKSGMVQSNQDFFSNLLSKGFLLLNASLVLSNQKVRWDAKQWAPFFATILRAVIAARSQSTLILLGKIAQEVDKLGLTLPANTLIAEHPYNVSFIKNQQVIELFAPLNLLKDHNSAKNKAALGHRLDKRLKKSDNASVLV